MIFLQDLQQFLGSFLLFDKNLDVSKIDPNMTNGLLVRGEENITKIGFGVSASV